MIPTNPLSLAGVGATIVCSKRCSWTLTTGHWPLFLMDHFIYRNRKLHCEDVPVADLAAKYGTPLYVYSKATLLHHLRAAAGGLRAGGAVDLLQHQDQRQHPHLPGCMIDHGCGCRRHQRRRAVSRLARPGASATRSFSPASARPTTRCGRRSCNNVLLFNVESEARTGRTGQRGRSLGSTAPVALRVNPDLPPKTHPKTDTSVKGVKFGLDIDTVLEFARGVVGNAERPRSSACTCIWAHPSCR